MDDKGIVFSEELSKQLIQLRFDNDWLFKKKKQPWKEFHKILLENGFPEDITVRQINKRYSYLYDLYKVAKKEKNKKWTYYTLFDKYYGKTKVPDKYESWDDEWRLKLILCIVEAKAQNVDKQNFWITVERAMRCQDLPLDCCIQDIKGLWHHIKMTLLRKHRVTIRQGRDSDWPLYPVMMEYCQSHEPELLLRDALLDYAKDNKTNQQKLHDSDMEDEYEFQWSKDITETFIQVRLQNDWIFKTKKWAWSDLKAIMVKEHGFPKELPSRDICKKWATTYAGYQKAKATGNKAWIYYPLFELYFGEGNLSLNPLVGWQEEWVLNLISARLDLHHLFRMDSGDRDNRWREVEKRLRSIGLPLDHSLLELPEIWEHLVRMYKWKKKFAAKGMLKEQWPYFDAMSQCDAIKGKSKPAYLKTKVKQKLKPNYNDNHFENDTHDDDFDDDIKLFDLKQRLEKKPKYELGGSCRCCSCEEGCVDIFQGIDDDGATLADKLKVIGGVLVQPSDNLPSQICLNCLKELESAFKFRRKCQQADKNFRYTANSLEQKIKVEIEPDFLGENCERNPDNNHNVFDELDTHFDDYQTDAHTDIEIKEKKRVKRERSKMKIPRRKKVKKDKYYYLQVCEICGKHTKNLVNHMDTHSTIRAYACDLCDKTFKFKSGLTLHKASHNPTPKKTCEVCGKTFNILAAYRKHYVYHANERKHECETCGKRFNSMDILKVHNLIHTDERPFSCPVCGKTFRTAGCVSRHKRIVHKVVKSQ